MKSIKTDKEKHCNNIEVLKQYLKAYKMLYTSIDNNFEQIKKCIYEYSNMLYTQHLLKDLQDIDSHFKIERFHSICTLYYNVSKEPAIKSEFINDSEIYMFQFSNLINDDDIIKSFQFYKEQIKGDIRNIKYSIDNYYKLVNDYNILTNTYNNFPKK